MHLLFVIPCPSWGRESEWHTGKEEHRIDGVNIFGVILRYTKAHACVRLRAHTHLCACAHTHTHTSARTHTLTRVHAHTIIIMSVSHARARRHTHVRAHSRTGARTHSRACARTHTHARARAHTHSRACTHTHNNNNVWLSSASILRMRNEFLNIGTLVLVCGLSSLLELQVIAWCSLSAVHTVCS